MVRSSSEGQTGENLGSASTEGRSILMADQASILVGEAVCGIPGAGLQVGLFRIDQARF